jgi:hypothetical protein
MEQNVKVRFEVYTAVKMLVMFSVLTPCGFIGGF